MKRLHDLFDQFVPHAEELWERTGADVQEGVWIDDGHQSTVPFYDLGEPRIRQIGDEEPFVTRRGRHLGRSALYEVEVDGIDHAARVFIPNDEYRTDHDLTVTSGTAWFTTIRGYAEDRDRRIFADNAVPIIQVGAPHSGQKLPIWLEALRVPQTLAEARNLSLARAAQTEQLIFAALSDIHDLPRDQLAIGDSRDANTTAAQFPYTGMYGNRIVGFDNKGRSAPHKISLDNLGEFTDWLSGNTVGAIAVAACLAKEGELHTLIGSASLNPNHLASSLTGTLRSLASGEAGIAIDWVPRDTHGIDVLYGRDALSKAAIWQALWAEHPNVVVKTVPRGTHPALLHPLGHRSRRQRVGKAIDEYRVHEGDVDAMDWPRVFDSDPNIRLAA